ncbi:MAG: hypothetical protein AAGA06_12490 [Pseudomonadota bacterium]
MKEPAESSDSAKWRKLGVGAAISMWSATAAEEAVYPGRARPMPDRVDYRFRNGWVDTGDLPCREALKADLPDRVVECPEGPFPQVVFAEDGDELDFSTFRHRPTLIRRAFQCALRAPAAGLVSFRLGTCGGVRLWLNGAAVAVFEPYLRNTRTQTVVEFAVPAGHSSLTLMLEDLHERDTTNFFSVTRVGGVPVEVGLPKGCSPTKVMGAARLLAGLHPDAVFYEAGAVRMVAGSLPDHAVAVDVDGPDLFLRGGMRPDPNVRRGTAFEIGPEEAAAPVFMAEDAVAGCNALHLTTEAGGARLTRSLGTTVLKEGVPLVGPLVARKAQAADEMARHAGFEPPVAALLALRGEKPERVAAIVSDTLTTIEERHDCSDFSILPLLRLWRDARDGLSSELQSRLREAFLGYRYWLDEPGNDVMWFWSENHVLCFHTAQLIAGRLFPDDVFTNSGLSGRARADDAAARLDRWFASIAEHGLCEWNSAAYYPIDMLGLFTLHDMAPDFRERAAELLDRIFLMVALHTSGRVPAGSQGRCYEKELLAGPATELGAVAAVAFGTSFAPGHDRAAALFCLSDYEVPDHLDRFWRPGQGAHLEARYTQGLDHAGKLSLWKSADMQLSTAMTGQAGEKGHQANVIDVQASAHPMARLWINHPGELKVWGDRRPSLLAGNHVVPHVAQHGSIAALLYDIDRPWTDIGFTQLFAPKGAFDVPERVAEWLVFRAGGGTVAIWCSASLEGVDGAYQGSIWRAHTLQAAWIVAVAEPGETPQTFDARLRAHRPIFDAENMVLHAAAPDGADLVVAFGGETRVGGDAMPFAPLSSVPHIGWNGAPLVPWSDEA